MAQVVESHVTTSSTGDTASFTVRFKGGLMGRLSSKTGLSCDISYPDNAFPIPHRLHLAFKFDEAQTNCNSRNTNSFKSTCGGLLPKGARQLSDKEKRAVLSDRLLFTLLHQTVWESEKPQTMALWKIS